MKLTDAHAGHQPRFAPIGDIITQNKWVQYTDGFSLKNFKKENR